MASDASIADDANDRLSIPAKFVGAASLIWHKGIQVSRNIFNQRGIHATPSTYTVESFAGVTGLRDVAKLIERTGVKNATVMWKTDSGSIVDAVAAGPFAQRELFAASVWAALD